MFDLTKGSFLFDEPGVYAIRVEYYGRGMSEASESNVVMIPVNEVGDRDRPDYEHYARLAPYFRSGAPETNAHILADLSAKGAKSEYTKYASYLWSIYLSDELLNWGREAKIKETYSDNWKYYSEIQKRCSELFRMFDKGVGRSPCLLALAVADFLSRDSRAKSDAALARLERLTTDDPNSRYTYFGFETYQGG